MLQRLEKYADNLEGLVQQRTADLEDEKQKTEKLLYRMLPRLVNFCHESKLSGSSLGIASLLIMYILLSSLLTTSMFKRYSCHALVCAVVAVWGFESAVIHLVVPIPICVETSGFPACLLQAEKWVVSLYF